MTIPANRRSLKNRLDASPAQVRSYFDELPDLLANFSLDVALAYMFARVELAHNMALYCGVVKLHKANREVARSVIDAHHMTRTDFHDRFEIVFGRSFPKDASVLLEGAEDVRDKVMHGKRPLEREKREAIAAVLDYAVKLNDVLGGIAGFRPFGDLRGFKGRGKSLPKATSRWILKGMGFGLS